MLLNSETNSGILKNARLFVLSRWRVWWLLSRPRAPLNEGVSSSLFEFCGICEHTGAVKETLRGGNLFPIHYPGFFFFLLNLLHFYCSLSKLQFNWRRVRCRCCLLKSHKKHTFTLHTQTTAHLCYHDSCGPSLHLSSGRRIRVTEIFCCWPFLISGLLLFCHTYYMGHSTSKMYTFHQKPKTCTKIGIMCHTVNNYTKFQL